MKQKTYKNSKGQVILQFTCENQDDLDIFGGLSNSAMFGAIIRHVFPRWRCPMDHQRMRDEFGADIRTSDRLHNAARFKVR